MVYLVYFGVNFSGSTHKTKNKDFQVGGRVVRCGGKVTSSGGPGAVQDLVIVC